MVRTKQTARKSTGGKRPPRRNAVRPGPALTEEELEKEEKRVADEQALASRRLFYKADAGDHFWDVSDASLDASLVIRGATTAALAGRYEIFGFYLSMNDWGGDHDEREVVLPSAGHLSIDESGEGCVDVPRNDVPARPLTGAFSTEILEDVEPRPYSSTGYWHTFEFVSKEGDPIRWDDRGMARNKARPAWAHEDEDEDRVGGDFDNAGKLCCGVVHGDVPALRLCDGDLLLSEALELGSGVFFARRRDAPVPFPRADYVRVSEKDQLLSAALERVRELEAAGLARVRELEAAGQESKRKRAKK